MTREEQRNKIVGKKFNRLTILKYSHSIPIQGPYYDCVCECGNKINTRATSITSGNTRSCGCLQIDFCKSGKANSKTGNGHGMSAFAEYNIWVDMFQRCNNKSQKYYKYYGGKGIFVCTRWDLFENFYIDMGKRPTPKHTIDRIDGTKGYSKENCRWATRMEQSHNIKTNKNITHNGETHCQAEWARRIGISNATIAYRLKKKMPLSEVLKKKGG